MREIKFRGVSKDTGKLVYGYYLKSGDTAQIFDGDFNGKGCKVVLK